ncbi:MAG: DUF349 domain-containing protein [Bacteroidetes bacterium]|nr:DUF349 domain-containing protein [Bacteroidota bacterium]
MKNELILKMEELLQKDAGEVANSVRTLQKEYKKAWAIEFEKARQHFIDEGGKAKEFQYNMQAEDEKFEKLIEKFEKKKKENDNLLAEQEKKNLEIKLEIISKINDLSKLSENVGAAFKMLQELQTKWKETGAVSTHKYKEIQAEYSKAIEEFHYNLKIYRDLQEHDLTRNFQLKTELIDKIKTVQTLDNIKEAERIIKVYRNEWDEIGPVPNEKWENLKAEYKLILDETYARIKAHYKLLEEQKENNLKEKEKLIELTKELITLNETSSLKQWNTATEKLIEIQKQWKEIGRAIEKDNERVWQEFRQLCDSFFENKKRFYSVLNEKYAGVKEKKSKLISKAEELQGSTDWQKTTPLFIRLQEDWKNTGSAGEKDESKLFARFRKACNTFFEAKKSFYEAQDASNESNLKLKEDIINELNTFALSEDLNANRNALKQFVQQFNDAGHVPLKDKKRINDAFYNKLDDLYNQLSIDKQEKAAIQFKSKVERLVASEKPLEALKKEADFLKRILDEANGNIRTYENNLGFFKTSKSTSNPFLKEVEEKIEIEKGRIAEITNKRKLVIAEIEKIKA